VERFGPSLAHQACLTCHRAQFGSSLARRASQPTSPENLAEQPMIGTALFSEKFPRLPATSGNPAEFP